MDSYYRVSVKISKSFRCHLFISLEGPNPKDGDKERDEEVLRYYLTDAHSLLLDFFTKEWMNKAAMDLKEHSKHPLTFMKCQFEKSESTQQLRVFECLESSGCFTFWLSTNGEDGALNSSKQYFRQAALVVAARSGDMGAWLPYDALFGEATGLPLRREFCQGDPRQWFGMKKIEDDVYLVWRKPGARSKEYNEGSVPAITPEQHDFLPEILRLILGNLVGKDTKADLIPTLIHCRLVNRNWYQVASEIAFSNVTVSDRQRPIFFNNPKTVIFLFLRSIQLCVVGRRLYHNYTFMTSYADFVPYFDEASIVDIVRHSPQLELFIIKGSEEDSNPFRMDLIYVIGLPSSKLNLTAGSSSSTPLPLSDLLEQRVIKELESRSKLFEEAIPREGHRVQAVPLSFICLASPSDTFLAGLAHILNTLVRSASKRAEPIVKVRFEGVGQWPFNEAMDWLERKHEWIIEHWPKQVVILVKREIWSPSRRCTVWDLGRPWPNGDITDGFVSTDYHV